ncbi:hypothetical protein [Fournierella sp.]|uniref:hypothetical protein n=1 Tax=Allofournierella sp. TaxID=1940256 RepID=UPI00307917AE
MPASKPTFTRAHLAALAGSLALFGFAILLFHSLAGGTLLAQNPYDSYLLQAQNWLEGSMAIQNGEQYPWLELAIFNEEYYLSFPPVPSVLALPWALWGGAVPSNLIAALYGLAVAAGVYLLFWQSGKTPETCAFFSLFVSLGSNTFWLSTSGGVWMLAQLLALAFCVWGCFFWLAGRELPAFFLLALAVGCRPFSALLAVVLFLRPVWGAVRKGRWKHLAAVSVLPALVALALGWYNWARFGNPLEFGHNFLPEFMREENGQFSLAYFWPNLKNLLRPVLLTETLDLSFPTFNGFLPFLANPLLLLCLHRTLGGWQFGARYLVDPFPFCLLFFARRNWEAGPAARGLLLAAILFNFYGAVYMLNA